MSKDTRYRLKLIELDGVTCISVKKSGKHYCAWKGEEPKGKFTHIYKDPKKKYRRSRDKFRGAFECPSFFAHSLPHHKDTVFVTIRQIYSVNQC